MIIPITPQMMVWAENRPGFENGRKLKELGDPRGRLIGDLTEFAFSTILRQNIIPHRCCGSTAFDYDFIVGEALIDTKAKERTYTYPDRMDRLLLDEGHVKADQEGFNCHTYVFSSVCLPNGGAGSIQFMGWVTKPAFWRGCHRVTQGALDGSFVEQADAGKMRYVDMNSMGSLIDRLTHYLTALKFS